VREENETFKIGEPHDENGRHRVKDKHDEAKDSREDLTVET